MPEGPIDRRFKAEADIAPLSLSEFDQVHALLRLKVEEVLSTVKGQIPVDTLKQPRKYDAAMAQTLVDKGVHSNKGLMQAAVVWHRHYTECGTRPEGPELLFPLAVLNALEELGQGATQHLLQLGPYLDKRKVRARTDLPPVVHRMLVDASIRSSSTEAHVDFACHEVLATIGTSTAAHVARALDWHRYHTSGGPVPEGAPMLPFQSQRSIIETVQANRAAVLSAMSKNDFDASKLDDALKDYILRQPNCSAAVTRLSKERPSAFDILASAFRYKPELVEIQRNIIRQVEAGTLDNSMGYFKCFLQTLPNSDQIVRDLQQEAARKEDGKITNVE